MRARVEGRVIEQDNSYRYRPGRRSKAYRLTEGHRRARFAEILADEFRAVFGVAPKLTTNPF